MIHWYAKASVCYVHNMLCNLKLHCFVVPVLRRQQFGANRNSNEKHEEPGDIISGSVQPVGYSLLRLLANTVRIYAVTVMNWKHTAGLPQRGNALANHCVPISDVRSPIRVWKTSNGHNSATRHPIDFVFGSRLWFLAKMPLFNLTAHALLW